MTIERLSSASGRNDPGPARAGAERISKVRSFTLAGVEAIPVTVEVSVTNGYPRIAIVGLPNLSVKESRDRVETALKACGLPFPDRRITINLTPAEIPKEGANFDLPIAMAILAEQRGLPRESFSGWAIAGEVTLGGTIEPVRGVLAMAMSVAGETGSRRRLMVPLANAAEAACVEGVDVVAVATLHEAIDALRGRSPAHAIPVVGATPARVGVSDNGDLSELRGQAFARRALEVAVAGGHNILLVGPPGTGKSFLAHRIPGILPPMTSRESLETTLVYSANGSIPSGSGLLTQRPFRAPHSSISGAGLIGGGRGPHPGEVSLAHNGVLFLDELPEFSPATLNLLRQPLEEGRVTVVRAHGSATFPARVVLVAAMNPCNCGFLGDTLRSCQCAPARLQQYRGRVSGPLMDRIDLHIEVARIPIDALDSDQPGESSAGVRARVVAAREIQTRRFEDEAGVHTNAQMGLRLLLRYAHPDPRGRALLRMAADRLGFSGRAFHRVMRVARTIADIDGCETVGEKQIAEAIGYRVLDRQGPGG